jgi:hypothetical protein
MLATASTAHAVAHASTALDPTVASDLAFAEQKLHATATSVPDDAYPFLTAPDGSWMTMPPRWWTSGFLPGSLWMLYGATGDPSWRSEAASHQAAIAPRARLSNSHNLRFLILDSFGQGYRFTQRPAYRRVILRAAHSLARRFDPIVGMTRSRGAIGSPGFTVVVDNLANLELLFWAARHGGDPADYGMALAHALRARHAHIRPDGSSFHVVQFDPRTGHVVKKGTAQGYSRNSTWSRGEAWALYGFTVAYRETASPRMLRTARRVADWFVSHLPSDAVPYWDFDAPNLESQPRDSSAAAIAASGLLELAQLDPDPARSARYEQSANAMLSSLSSSSYSAAGHASDAIILHGTYNEPAGSFDTGLIFGDYYFIEALRRYERPPRTLAHPLKIKVSPRRNHLGKNLYSLRTTVCTTTPGRIRAALLPRRDTARALGYTPGTSAVIGRAGATATRAGCMRLRIRLERRARLRMPALHHAGLIASAALRPAAGHAAATGAIVELRPRGH